MYISLCAIRSWNWNWKLTEDIFLIERWIQRTHRCSAVRCWPWGVFSSWLASRDLGTTRSSYLAWVGPVDTAAGIKLTPLIGLSSSRKAIHSKDLSINTFRLIWNGRHFTDYISNEFSTNIKNNNFVWKWHIYASLGLNELKAQPICQIRCVWKVHIWYHFRGFQWVNCLKI